jgi:putative zinc finger/helix-turn-helix YgiT family protein
MKCFECSAEMQATREQYHYVESGLPNVWIENVEVRRCPECGDEEVVLPALEGLHRAIAAALVRKPARLTGAEVRFIRKTLGWSGKVFAERMWVDPSTVSRWERSKESVGPQSDLLVRYLFATRNPEHDYHLDDLAEPPDEREPPSMPLNVKHASGTWQAAPAA